MHLCFFSVSNSRPLLKDLYTLITPNYAAHWKIIGTLLGLPIGCLEATGAGNPTDLLWCCNKMLEMWLARNTDVTWKDILKAIDSPAIPHGIPSLTAVKQCDQLLEGT